MINDTQIYVFPKDHQLAGFAVEFYRNDKKSIGKEIVARVFKLFRCKHCYLRFVWKPSRDKHQNEIPHDKECQNGNGDNKCQMKFITEEERDDHQRNCSK